MTSGIFERLVETFMKFPGIGPRQARRFVYHLMRQDEAGLDLLVNDIRAIKRSVGRCEWCQRFYSLDSAPPTLRSGQADKKICELCLDTSRDPSLLMIVEKDIDLENIRKSGTFNGYFFVLGSLASMTETDKPKLWRSKELLKRIEQMSELREIILALSATPAGDYTVEVLKQYLMSNNQLPMTKVKVSILGRGLSTGTELEYSDADTLKNALKNRG